MEISKFLCIIVKPRKHPYSIELSYVKTFLNIFPWNNVISKDSYKSLEITLFTSMAKKPKVV